MGVGVTGPTGPSGIGITGPIGPTGIEPRVMMFSSNAPLSQLNSPISMGLGSSDLAPGFIDGVVTIPGSHYRIMGKGGILSTLKASVRCIGVSVSGENGNLFAIMTVWKSIRNVEPPQNNNDPIFNDVASIALTLIEDGFSTNKASNSINLINPVTFSDNDYIAVTVTLTGSEEANFFPPVTFVASLIFE